MYLRCMTSALSCNVLALSSPAAGGRGQESLFADAPPDRCCSLLLARLLAPPAPGLSQALPLALSSSSLRPLRSRSMTYLSILSVAEGELSCRARCSTARLRRLTHSFSRLLRSRSRSRVSVASECWFVAAAVVFVLLSLCCGPSCCLWRKTRRMSGCVSGCERRNSARICCSSLSSACPVSSCEGAQSYNLCLFGDGVLFPYAEAEDPDGS